MAGLGGLSGLFAGIPAGYMQGRNQQEELQARKLQNQVQQLQLRNANDERNASLASILGGGGQLPNPAAATIAGMSGNPPQAQGPMPTPMGGQVLPGAAPTQGPMPGAGPSPSPQPQPQMQQAGQMSLGQMLTKLKADPRNQGIPDATLLSLAGKFQNALLPQDKMLLEFMQRQNQQDLTRRGQDLSHEDRISAQTISHQDRQATLQATIDNRNQLNDLKTSLTQNAKLGDDDANFLAQQRLAGDKSALTGLGTGAVGAANRMAVNREMRKLLLEQNPKADGADVAAATAGYMGDTAALRSLSTKSAQIDMAANEMKKFAPLVTQASNAIDRTQFPTFNALQNAVSKGTGGENVIRLIDSVNAFKNAYSQVVARGGTATNDARQRADEVINAAWSKGQVNTAIDQLTKEANAALSATQESRKSLLKSIYGGGTNAPEQQQPGDSPAAQEPTVSNW